MKQIIIVNEFEILANMNRYAIQYKQKTIKHCLITMYDAKSPDFTLKHLKTQPKENIINQWDDIELQYYLNSELTML